MILAGSVAAQALAELEEIGGAEVVRGARVARVAARVLGVQLVLDVRAGGSAVRDPFVLGTEDDAAALERVVAARVRVDLGQRLRGERGVRRRDVAPVGHGAGAARGGRGASK